MNSIIADKFDEDRQEWVNTAVSIIEAENSRSADTHLIQFPLPAMPGIELYLKDESTHVTGSLKHRLARSLFLYSLCNGWLGPNTTIVEASSGSTAVSEAYFARLIGLPFIAVIPASTSAEKISLIEGYGGECHLVQNASEVYEASHRLVASLGDAHYMDQFTFAERATDWRGNNNIAESTLHQMSAELHPTPTWIVAAAGTGGTSATFGRYIRYQGLSTRLCVPDPVGSAFFEAWHGSNPDAIAGGSQIEGIGRPQVEPSFIPGVVDRMLRVENSASIGAMRYAHEVLGRSVGPSTGTNLWAAIVLAKEMHEAGRDGSIVTVLCDSGERYFDTYYNDDWIAKQGWEPESQHITVKNLVEGTTP